MIRCLILSAVVILAAASPAPAQQRAAPGEFDYYLLALSWSPSYCAAHGGEPGAREECGRRRGFVVHGLWPQNENGTWPAACRAVPRLPADLVERELASMPNRALVEHEWVKHGSCTNFDGSGYFDALERAWRALTVPASLRDAAADAALPLADLRAEFVAANPGLPAEAMSWRCGSGGELIELRICLAKSLTWRACGAREADACPATVRIPAAPGIGR